MRSEVAPFLNSVYSTVEVINKDIIAVVDVLKKVAFQVLPQDVLKKLHQESKCMCTG